MLSFLKVFAAFCVYAVIHSLLLSRFVRGQVHLQFETEDEARRGREDLTVTPPPQGSIR